MEQDDPSSGDSDHHGKQPGTARERKPPREHPTAEATNNGERGRNDTTRGEKRSRSKQRAESGVSKGKITRVSLRRMLVILGTPPLCCRLSVKGRRLNTLPPDRTRKEVRSPANSQQATNEHRVVESPCICRGTASAVGETVDFYLDAINQKRTRQTERHSKKKIVGSRHTSTIRTKFVPHPRITNHSSPFCGMLSANQEDARITRAITKASEHPRHMYTYIRCIESYS